MKRQSRHVAPGFSRGIADGVLVVDKPEGPTSHDVVTLTRRALGVSRIGHTGTLDPLATGVLPLVVGRATRLARFLTAGDKTYEATVAFGRSTDTYDAKGREVTACDRRPTRAALDAALETFRGEFEQTPPAYSSKNIDGERAYELARKNVRRGTLVPPARPKPVMVNAKRLDVLAFDGDTATLSMTVTAGFYVRSLAHDVGDALGCGAMLVALRRTRSGEFDLDAAVPLAEILRSTREDLITRLMPMAGLLRDVPAVTLRGPASLERLKNGVELGPSDFVAPLGTLAAAPEGPPNNLAAAQEGPPNNIAAPQNIIVRLLTPEGDLAGLARPAKTAGFLHGWVVLG